MQPRLGLAAALVDGHRVGFEHGGAQNVDALGDGGERTELLPRQDRVAVAVRDLVGEGGEMLQRRLDDGGRRERGAESND